MLSFEFSNSGLRLLTLVALISGSALLAGCESKEDNTLAKAQQCLDKATTASAADTCYNMVNGINNSKADLIRCAAGFIGNGLTGEKVAEAFDTLKNGSGGGGQTATSYAMGTLVFSSTANADRVLAECTRSGVRSMERLATMANMSTMIADLGGLDPSNFNSADMDTAIANLQSGLGSIAAEDVEKLAAVVVQAEASFCNEGSSFKSNEICTTLTAAVQSGNAQTIIQELLDKVKP